MVNSCHSSYYFPLVSGSGGQDSLYSFNSCSKKTLIRMVKIRVHLCNLWENKKSSGGQDSLYSFNYFPLVSGSTTIGASLIVFVKAPLNILSLHIPDEPYDNYS